MTQARAANPLRTKRLVLGTLAGALALAFALGQGVGSPSAAEITHYAAGEDRLYRFWDDGRIEYLIVDFAEGSNDGIPGWAPIYIDHGFTRNRMGSVIVSPRR